MTGRYYEFTMPLPGGEEQRVWILIMYEEQRVWILIMYEEQRVWILIMYLEERMHRGANWVRGL